MSTRALRPLAALAMVVLLISCGGSNDPTAELDEATGTSASRTNTGTDTTESAERAPTADSEPNSIEDYLGSAANLVRGGRGGAFATGNFDEDTLIEEQRLIQQEIQMCMQTQGFTYVPEEVGTGLRFFVASQSEGESATGYAETQGFGISTRFDALLEGDVDLSESTSPNDEHLASLSEGEADAWQFALRGAPPERNEQGQLIDPETGDVLQGQRGGQASGCTGDAQSAVRGDISAIAALSDQFEELDARIEADPRITEIRRDWVDCMRTEGFDFADETEARQSINALFRPLLRSFFQSRNLDDAQGGGRGPGAGNQLQAIAGLELTPEQEVELEALQDLERSTATASLTCHGDTQQEVTEIQQRYEQEFVEANRAALEAIAG